VDVILKNSSPRDIEILCEAQELVARAHINRVRWDESVKRKNIEESMKWARDYLSN
jgi:altronate dehydratase